jgi:hypothetical protein
MYRHDGNPVSLYVLQHERSTTTASVFGHDAVMWTAHDTTYVLLGKESEASLRQLAVDLN